MMYRDEEMARYFRDEERRLFEELSGRKLGWRRRLGKMIKLNAMLRSHEHIGAWGAFNRYY